MKLKIAFLTNYPQVDNVNWKKEFITKCLENQFDIDIFYGKSNYNSLIKNYFIKRKFNSNAHKKIKKTSKNFPFFKHLGLKINKLNNFNSATSINKIKNGNYTIIVTALDQILSNNFITNIPTKIINIHYGLLPEIKGMSSTEWTYLITKKVTITLHYIDAGIDTGEIISKHKIDINSVKSISEFRNKIQNKIPTILIDFLKKYPNIKLLQENNKKGKLYTYMHSDLKQLLKV